MDPIPPDRRPTPRRTLAWWLFVVFAAGLLPLMLYASYDFGATWDEKARHKNGELVWEFMRGLRPRSDFATDGSRLYGGLFDVLCAAIEQYIPLNRYVVRHGVNAFFGWIGIVYGGRLAARLFGSWAGLLAMGLFVASPRYLGEAMNNPKDLPFAALSMAALYYITTVSPRFPYISIPTGLKIAVALALALNVRAGALMYLGYFGLLVIGYVIVGRTWSNRQLFDTATRLAAVSIVALVLGTAFWPWAQEAPLIRPLQALFGLSEYPYDAGMLFAGKVITSTKLPMSYVPWWFAIITPPVVLLGIALAAVIGVRHYWKPLLLLAGVVLLPATLVIVRQSTLYDSVRHLLFIYPPLVVIAAGGWAAAILRVDGVWPRRFALAALAAGFINVMSYEIRSYPNEIVYFNELVGGPKGAFGRYDMDYWGNCLLEAVAWTAHVAKRSGQALKVSGEPWGLVQVDVERFRQIMFTHPFRADHHLDVRLARGSPQFVNALVNDGTVLYRVETADGAPLCIVKRGPAFEGIASKINPPPADISHRELLQP